MSTSPAPASTTRQEIAGQTDTSDDGLTPPGAVHHRHIERDAADEVERLSAFLEEHFPAEVAWSNRQHPESAVETAMRLLRGRQARSDYVTPRCPGEWCNKAAGHTDPHGWVHFD